MGRRGQDVDGKDGAARVLAVDVGNTQTHLGLYEGDDLVLTRDITTHRRLTTDEVEIRGRAALGLPAATVDPGPAFDGAILSCVVPVLTDTWEEALARMSATRPLTVGPGLKTGMRMRYKDPSEIGSDRIADVVAAREDPGAPVVVVDMGTTTNIEVVDADGVFRGGLIAPGLRLGARALSEAAARLPMIEIRAPREVIGQTTRAAMQSGVVFGEVARIDGLLDAVMAELGEEATVVVTGDDAATIAALLRHEARVDETLTLRGLRILWQANSRSASR